ncbi:unnamed protein product [Prunus brigantina]
MAHLLIRRMRKSTSTSVMQLKLSTAETASANLRLGASKSFYVQKAEAQGFPGMIGSRSSNNFLPPPNIGHG